MNTTQQPQLSLWKRMSKTLLFWVLLAIIVGAILGQFLPSWAIVPFATFNDVFGKYLSFVVPMIIIGLVTPAIFELGRSAGKWLLLTVAIAYGSTMVAGFGTWGIALLLFPWLLSGQKVPDLASPENAVASIMDPSFAMPPVFGVMTALILAIVLGLGMAAVRADKMMAIFRELRDLIMKVILKTIVPLLPLHILGIFMNMSKSGQFAQVLVALGKIFIFSFVLTVVMLLLQYTIAGSMAKQNPLKALWGMKDAYFTALGTSSSAATIPVTERCAVNNGVNREIADFVVPLCATIHLAGSTIKITAFAIALQYMMGINPAPSAMAGFIMMLGVIMVAAPGVPGGAITAAQGVLQGMLGFTDPMYGIMVAMYVAADSFGTATNVTGDGAIAIAVDALSKGSLGTEKGAAMEAAEDIVSGRELTSKEA
ncbi:dicarboxylate/amino acid:cation symporter [Arcanobacterium hippocoleae]|uniref:Na+/H+-dicarboxylate symporter n=1 Tax=Arcanobacterium hippocoleae TaxID=149017 RepID=A0ABU1T2J9_9ACTO|nr:dicarboxylate/amino acid:cation symporter [Arcanobacterium hippocoleae]MDR6939612.1 Na+/H+-dicarboxylate symporter [Arcanobacterium hippocoleae]